MLQCIRFKYTGYQVMRPSKQVLKILNHNEAHESYIQYSGISPECRASVKH
jgi:hypothetical protein